MKRYLALLWLSVSPFLISGQTLEWSALFEVHSSFALAGLSPNSLKDESGNIVSLVVENDILKLYKYDAGGNPVHSLDTQESCGEFTKIIRIGTDHFALLFDNTPSGIHPTYKFLKIGPDLQVVDDFDLNFPFQTIGTRLNSLFEYNDYLYVSLFKDADHYLFKIETNQSLTLVNSGVAGFESVATKTLLNDGKVVFDYSYGTNHKLWCVSLVTGQTVWEENYTQAGSLHFQYKTALGDQETLYFAGVERTWVNGEPKDTLQLKAINSFDGTVAHTSFVSPFNNCLIYFNDLKYNTLNDRLYLTYSNCFPDFSISLLELDTNFNIVNQVVFDAEQDELLVGGESHVHITGNGKVVFVYKSKKDPIEKGNLYLAVLDSNLDSSGVLEINFEPENSSEALTDIFSYDDSKIVITGIIPDPDPAIFTEQVRFFTLMVDIENLLSTTGNVLDRQAFFLYPNPVFDILKVETPEDIKMITVYNMRGENVFTSTHSTGNVVDVSNLTAGMYIITLTNMEGKTINSKFIKR